MLLGLIASTAWYVHLIPKVAVSLVMLYLAWMMLDAWSRVQLAAWLQPASLWRNIRQPQSTAVIFVLVILTALLSNLVWGVAFGLLCAVFVFVQRQSQTVVRRMGLLSLRRSVVMRNAAQNDCLQQQGDRALYVELQGALFFGTSEQLLKAVRAALKPDQLYLILDAHKVVEVDDSGCEAIERLQADMVRRGGALLLSAWDEALQWRSPAEIGALRQAMKQPVLRSLDEACEWVEDALIERFAPEDVRTEVCEFDPASSPLRITRYMDEKERRDFMRLLEPCQFANGSYLCRKGDASDDMHIVVCGRVDIWVKHGQRDAVRLASFRQGSSYGEMGLLRNEPRVADAVAVGEVSTLRLSRDVLERLQHEQPALLSHLLRVISEDLANRLSQTNKALRWALQA
jgi:CRP-like cAMP-binding protein/anti-anti-sigma regulatory factor